MKCVLNSETLLFFIVTSCLPSAAWVLINVLFDLWSQNPPTFLVQSSLSAAFPPFHTQIPQLAISVILPTILLLFQFLCDLIFILYLCGLTQPLFSFFKGYSKTVFIQFIFKVRVSRNLETPKGKFWFCHQNILSSHFSPLLVL